MALKIIPIKSDDEIQACFNVVSQLRPYIKEKEFFKVICNQFKKGYQLTAVVSDQKKRSTGLGSMLLNWLHDEARKNKCDQLHLDSGVQRKDAHRFYEREGMDFASHHYSSEL